MLLLLEGKLCEGAYFYQSPTPPLNFFVNSNQVGGAWALVPLIYASDSGAVRICQRGGGGGKARERSSQAGEGVGGGFPPSTVNPPAMHGREIFEIRVWKRHFFPLLGVVYVVA